MTIFMQGLVRKDVSGDIENSGKVQPVAVDEKGAMYVVAELAGSSGGTPQNMESLQIANGSNARNIATDGYALLTASCEYEFYNGEWRPKKRNVELTAQMVDVRNTSPNVIDILPENLNRKSLIIQHGGNGDDFDGPSDSVLILINGNQILLELRKGDVVSFDGDETPTNAITCSNVDNFRAVLHVSEGV